MRKFKKILMPITVVVLLLLFCFSAAQIMKICREYKDEDRLHQALLSYKPDTADDSSAFASPSEPEETTSAVTDAVVNQSILVLQENYPDTVGWLTVDGTKIDYPFVQAEDNQKYLRCDMDLNYLSSGTVFMDYRNDAGFTDFVTIIYGHQMKNESMFGTMDWFRDSEFFLENSTARIYLPYRTLDLEIVAVLVVKSTDETVYDLRFDIESEKTAFLDYVEENAEQLRADCTLTENDTFVLLSTCVYDYTNARMVLVARIENN